MTAGVNEFSRVVPACMRVCMCSFHVYAEARELTIILGQPGDRLGG